jgi:hypothetical protein
MNSIKQKEYPAIRLTASEIENIKTSVLSMDAVAKVYFLVPEQTERKEVEILISLLSPTESHVKTSVRYAGISSGSLESREWIS